jgi:hypothetical protein
VLIAKGPQHQAARARVSSLVNILQEMILFRKIGGLVRPPDANRVLSCFQSVKKKKVKHVTRILLFQGAHLKP